MSVNHLFVTPEDVSHAVADWARESESLLCEAQKLPSTAAWRREIEEDLTRRQAAAVAASSAYSGANKTRQLTQARADMSLFSLQSPITTSVASFSGQASEDTLQGAKEDEETAVAGGNETSIGPSATALPTRQTIDHEKNHSGATGDSHALRGGADRAAPLDFADEAAERRKAAIEAALAYDRMSENCLKSFRDRLDTQVRQLEVVSQITSNQKANRGH